MLPSRFMLMRHQPSRRSFLVQTLSLATTAGLAIAGGGCASIVGVQDVEFNGIVITQELQGAFFWWTELTIDYDTSSVNRATLMAVTVDVLEPKGTGDLSFLQDVQGTAVVGEMKTPIAFCDKFPRGEQAVIMQVQYRDDLRPLFFDNGKGDTIRIEWTGHTNPAFTQWGQWPLNGFSLRARAKISIE
jgi:hypothetical protein